MCQPDEARATIWVIRSLILIVAQPPTENKDFGDMAFQQARPVPGLVPVRIDPSRRSPKAPRLLAAIKRFGDTLFGRYRVIEEARFSSRALCGPRAIRNSRATNKGQALESVFLVGTGVKQQRLRLRLRCKALDTLGTVSGVRSHHSFLIAPVRNAINSVYSPIAAYA